MIVSCPARFDSGVASDFASSLFVYSERSDFSIDFSTIGFVEPFSSLVLAHGLKQFIHVRTKNKLGNAINYPVRCPFLIDMI